MGSTRKVPPSISPTLRSEFTPDSGSPCWVPPVMRSVFSGTESFGSNSGSTLVSISGGAASLPTLGISLAMVELVLVMWGFNGFSIWALRHVSTLSWIRSLAGRITLQLKGRANLGAVRADLRMILATDMMRGA